MRILAFDTATEACSVALRSNEDTIEHFSLGKKHSEHILPMVEELLAEAGTNKSELDLIAFGRGPGMFTGLRISASIAQGLAYGLDLPVIPVSSLAALAQGLHANKVLSAFDARMGQVYFAAYERNENDIMELIGEEGVMAPEDIPIPDSDDWVGAGSGWTACKKELKKTLGKKLVSWEKDRYPHAKDIAHLAEQYYLDGEAVQPRDALPVYIRDDVAKKMDE